MKIKETTQAERGGIGRGGLVTLSRVIEIEGDTVPEGAVKVSDKTETHDWKEEN